MATSRPSSALFDGAHSVAWYGRLAERVGGALACIALAFSAGSGALVTRGAPTPAAAVEQLTTVAAADPASLSLVAAICHFSLLALAVGTWLMGLGFVLTGFFE